MGYQVSQPLVSDSRYDFIIDIKGKLYKIQVKTSRVEANDEFFSFTSSSSHTNSKRTINRSYTKDEIDYFATIYNNECYIIPIEDCGAREVRLRLKPTKNNQIVGVRFAKDYKLKNIFPND